METETYRGFLFLLLVLEILPIVQRLLYSISLGEETRFLPWFTTFPYGILYYEL